MKPYLSESREVIIASTNAESINLPLHNGKKIIGSARHEHDGVAVNLYFLDDGTDVMVDDNGKAVKKWPGEK